MSELQWYIQVSVGKKAGPISFERLKELVEQKRIFPGTNVRSTAPDAAWTSAKDVPGLFSESVNETENPTTDPEPIEETEETDDTKPEEMPDESVDAGTDIVR